jgi:hypothetical protein
MREIVVIRHVPRGNPKQVLAIRLEQALIDEVKRRAGARQVSATIEALIVAWLKRARQADPLVKPARPTAREPKRRPRAA